MRTIEDARTYVWAKHARHFDAGGQPYPQHLEAVESDVRAMLSLLPEGTLTEEEQIAIRIAALCHDVVEDVRETGVSEEDFAAQGFAPLTNAIVLDLTRRPVDPGTYLEKITALTLRADVSFARWLGRILVKRADNRHNRQPERIAQLPIERQGVARRYDRSLAILEQALHENGFAMVLEPIAA